VSWASYIRTRRTHRSQCIALGRRAGDRRLRREHQLVVARVVPSSPPDLPGDQRHQRDDAPKHEEHQNAHATKLDPARHHGNSDIRAIARRRGARHVEITEHRGEAERAADPLDLVADERAPSARAMTRVVDRDPELSPAAPRRAPHRTRLPNVGSSISINAPDRHLGVLSSKRSGIALDLVDLCAPIRGGTSAEQGITSGASRQNRRRFVHHRHPAAARTRTPSVQRDDEARHLEVTVEVVRSMLEAMNEPSDCHRASRHGIGEPFLCHLPRFEQ
jgi:hypothetical protein